jgi:hypothetical protein
MRQTSTVSHRTRRPVAGDTLQIAFVRCFDREPHGDQVTLGGDVLVPLAMARVPLVAATRPFHGERRALTLPFCSRTMSSTTTATRLRPAAGSTRTSPTGKKSRTSGAELTLTDASNARLIRALSQCTDKSRPR